MTATFAVVLCVYAGVALLVSSTAWWPPLLLLPSMLSALWLAMRWDTPTRRWIVVAVLLLGEVTWATGALFALSPAASFGLAVAGAVTVSQLPVRRATAAAGLVALVLVTGLLSLFRSGDQVAGYLLVAPVVTAVLVLVFWLNRIAWQLFAELDATRRAETELAIMKERVRFAGDLHDIQGHTLHVVKLKTALAEKLLRSDPDTAEEELRQVRVLIAETIEQTRSLAYGQRRLTLAGELENAKNLFEAAGIDVNVTREGVPELAFEEAMGLVLREATTNILRHAAASRVGIIADATGISVSNDGCEAGSLPPLRGLRNLEQRVSDAGGHLTVVKNGMTFLTAASFDGQA